MTKAKTAAAEAETPTGEDPALFQAETEGQDAAGADNAEAEEAAKAEAERLAAEEAFKAEAPRLNLSALSHCARQIDMLNTGGHRLQLVDELKQLYGAEIAEDQDAGTFTVTCEGVTHDPALSLDEALHQWAGAARRAILEATA